MLVQDFLDSPQERTGTFKVMQWVLESPQELITGVLESPQELITGVLESPQELTTGMLDILTGIMDLCTVILSPMEGRYRSSLEELTGKEAWACTIRAAPRGHHGAWTLQAIPGHGLLRSA